jgi:hypothetical protein
MFGETFKHVQPILMSALTAGIHQYVNQPQQDGETSKGTQPAEPAKVPEPQTVPADHRAGDPSI